MSSFDLLGASGRSSLEMSQSLMYTSNIVSALFSRHVVGVTKLTSFASVIGGVESLVVGVASALTVELWYVDVMPCRGGGGGSNSSSSNPAYKGSGIG